jgi:RNA polymerase sigma-70 factor, ECF subfamily
VTDPDRDALERFRGGDARAFEELVLRHERRVYNVCLRMLGRPEDARDATQDAFISVLRRADSFRGQSAFSTWLHRIAVNACYDLLRKRQRAPLLDAEPSEPGPPSPDPAEAAAEALDVRDALLEVPPEFRAVLVLHDVQDLPYEEIAAVLDVPVGTVKSRLHRGRVALARALRGTPGPADASEEMMEP